MKLYPVYFNIENRDILVIGGGKVALRKVNKLLEAGARVKIVASRIDPGFFALTENKNVTIKLRKFEEQDLDSKLFVFAATDDELLNSEISELAKSRNIFCNIADSADKSDFIIPSCIQRGDLVLSVSTSGKSPALSRKLRKDLQKEFGDEYSVFLYFLGKLRQIVVSRSKGDPENKNIFRDIVFGELLKFIKEKNIQGIEDEISKIVKDHQTSEKLLDDLLEKNHNYFFDVEKIED